MSLAKLSDFVVGKLGEDVSQIIMLQTVLSWHTVQSLTQGIQMVWVIGKVVITVVGVRFGFIYVEITLCPMPLLL